MKTEASRKNIYHDIIHSLMDKNRKRVKQYYCARGTCRTTFFDASCGYACPECGSMGIISEFKNDTALEHRHGRKVLGYLDGIGRLFCARCAERYGLGDDASLIVYTGSAPYCRDQCDVCRTRLDSLEETAG
ncbi:MAG TPA: hypothetical protein PLR71_02370 [Deltaproteobacteria bacterium]|nr:hypothetical protein [Deltaproteobacteria bacterium]